MMERKYYTGEQILEALSEVGIGAGDISEVMSCLGRMPSAEPNLQPNLQPTCNQLATDWISRKEAIDAIDGLPNCYNGFSDSYDKSYIIGVLEELPSAGKTGKWIPCSERLPDDGEEYLVTVQCDGHSIVDIDQCFSYGWDDYGADVIAWMPLPKPYQEDKQ